MARSFDAATLALLDGDSLAQRDLMLVTLPEGTFGFWSDVYDVQFPAQWPGVTFVGSASLVTIAPPTQSLDDSVQPLTVTLSGLATDVLASVGAYNLHRGKVEVARALYDPTTRSLVSVIVWFRGYIDRDEIREADGAASLVVECVSRARELDRATHRTRSFSDQIRDFPGDRGFEFAVRTAVTKITWGNN